MTTDRDPNALLPLTPAMFHVLVAMADGDRHGYAIIKDVAERTSGAVELSTGTLYGILKRVLAEGLAIEGKRPAARNDDERRRYYRLTDFGRRVVAAETKRLEAMVECRPRNAGPSGVAVMTGRQPRKTNRLYAFLLRLLPGEFRGDFGDDMAADFADRRAEEPPLRLWRRELPALVATALREHLHTLWRDIRYALRLMRRTPGFTAMAVVMLGLGTGANVAVFTVIDAVVLRSPFPDPDALVIVGVPERSTSSQHWCQSTSTTRSSHRRDRSWPLARWTAALTSSRPVGISGGWTSSVSRRRSSTC